MATWDDVSRVVGDLPETSVSTSTQGHRGWSVRSKSLAWERPLRPAERRALGAEAPDGPILAVRVADVGVKEALVADDPGVFFTMPHYDGFAAVLVRLERISVEELAELVVEAWVLRAPKRLLKEHPDLVGP